MPILIIVGSKDELRSGKGKVVIPITQAAAALGINENTFRRLIEKDLITPYPERMRGMPLFLEDEVERLRESREKAGY